MYPCCVPTLGDSKGASCVGLAIAKLQSFLLLCNVFLTNKKSEKPII
jgi:hypothetical protein